MYRPKTIATLSSTTQEIVAISNSIKTGFNINLDELDAWIADKVLLLEAIQSEKAEKEAKQMQNARRR